MRSDKFGVRLPVSALVGCDLSQPLAFPLLINAGTWRQAAADKSGVAGYPAAQPGWDACQVTALLKYDCRRIRGAGKGGAQRDLAASHLSPAYSEQAYALISLRRTDQQKPRGDSAHSIGSGIKSGPPPLPLSGFSHGALPVRLCARRVRRRGGALRYYENFSAGRRAGIFMASNVSSCRPPGEQQIRNVSDQNRKALSKQN